MSKELKSTKKASVNAGLITLAVVLLAGLGLALALNDGDNKDKDSGHSSHSASMDDDHSHGHSHSGSETYEYESHDSLPEVEITNLQKNSDDRWELTASFSNFIIDEEAVDSENEPGVGHAHIYVNGEKITRLFSENYVFEDDLKEGDEVTVELNTNDHKVYTHDGQRIKDSTTVVQ